MNGRLLILAVFLIFIALLYPKFMSGNSETIIKQTKPNPEFAVIWLHGLGADGNDFVPVLDSMDFSQVPGIKFVFPHAPMRPITINGGMTMRGWYDIVDMNLGRQQDAEGIKQSASLVKHLIDDQIEVGFLQEKIFLAGFSQGGAIALYSGLTLDYDLAGIVALSTYMPIMDQISIKQKPDVFYAHGDQDPIIPIELAKSSKLWLIDNEVTVSWHQYSMQHQVLMEEIAEINQWFIKKIQNYQNK